MFDQFYYNVDHKPSGLRPLRFVTPTAWAAFQLSYTKYSVNLSHSSIIMIQIYV